MAIPFLNHLDLQSVSELQNAILHKTTSGAASNVEGKIIYDTGSNTLKYYNGSAWINLDGTGDISAVTVNPGEGLEVEDGSSSATSGAFSVTLGLASTVAGDGLGYSAGVLSVGGGTGLTQQSTGLKISDTGVTADSYGSGTEIPVLTINAQGQVTAASTSAISSSFILEDGDGTELEIAMGKEVKFVEGGGIDINWTDTSTVSDSDPYDLTFTHGATSSASSSNNSGTTVIQDVGLDTYGHVTSLGTVELDIPAAANDATITLTGGDGIASIGAFTTNQGTAEELTIDVDNTVVRTSGNQTIAGNKTFSNVVTINGDLIVSGNQTTKASETVLIEDNIITLNSNETGTPSEDAGIEVERGTGTNVKLAWNESNGDWEYTMFNHAGTPALTTYKIAQSYAASIGDGENTAYTVTHNLGTRDVMVQLYDASSYETVYADVVRTNTTQITLTFASAPASNDIKVLVTTVA